MLYLCGTLILHSTDSLEEVAKRVSSKLLAGIPFEGREDSILDEVPAVYVKQAVFGLFISLSGYQERQQYALHIQPWNSQQPAISKKENLLQVVGYETVDLSEWVALLLSDQEGIAVTVPKVALSDVVKLFGP